MEATVSIPYTTLEHSIQMDHAERAARHIARGTTYLLAGKKDYAQGSFRKAKKNLDRLLRHMVEDAIIDVLANDMAVVMEQLMLEEDNETQG